MDPSWQRQIEDQLEEAALIPLPEEDL